ncbi:MAG TPA: urea ABC transporter permease subunit UrtC [Vineibacter sp.]|nr:urea ABC transporter permease subunit UrtC [Vineibacter sp.]
MLSPRGWLAFLAIGFALIVLLPVANRLMTPGGALHLPDYLVPLIGKYCCYAMLALAMDLIWGYAGILSLGQGAFFALGGYCMGMYLMRQIGDRGVYKHEVLPDFMVFLNWKELPWYWHGFDMFWFAALMVVLVPAALAFVLGWLAFRSRVTGVYLSIITQAMTFALMLAFFRNNMGFGGNNGLTDFKDLLGFPIQTPSTRVGLLIASAVGLGLSFLLCRWIVASKLGRVCLALRDAESRVRFLGYSPTGAKLFVFVVAAMISGLAGALYVPQVGIINPGEFSPANSIEIAIWVAVGGRGTLLGAILGAFIVNIAKTWLTGAAPEIWLFFLGALFIVVTLFLPNGVVGVVRDWQARRATARAGAAAAPELANGAAIPVDGATVAAAVGPPDDAGGAPKATSRPAVAT